MLELRTLDIDEVADAIIRRLRPLGLRKVILFGSHAWGQAGADSDVDVLVVVDDDTMPQSAADRRVLYQRVSRRLRDLQREMAMDLIVHTVPMHERFVERDSMFARKVLQEGTVIYAKGD